MELALHAFTQALQLDTVSLIACANQVAIYGIRGEYQDAINDFSRALELEPNHQSSNLTVGTQ